MSPAMAVSRPRVIGSTNEYSTSEASRICGASKRQLQWIDEQAIVSPRQYGRKRHYTPGDLLAILIIEAMRKDKGISLLKTRPAVRWLQRGGRLNQIIASQTPMYLLSDGAASHHLIDSADQLMDKMIDARRPMLLMCVSCLAERIPEREGDIPAAAQGSVRRTANNRQPHTTRQHAAA